MHSFGLGLYELNHGGGMAEPNKEILRKANAAVIAGDNEGFLSFCADDIVWSTVGGETLRGKEAVRSWMAREYTEPPEFDVQDMIEGGDFVVAIGTINTKENGASVANSYCDVWRVRKGRLAELRAFVVKDGEKKQAGGRVEPDGPHLFRTPSAPELGHTPASSSGRSQAPPKYRQANATQYRTPSLMMSSLKS